MTAKNRATLISKLHTALKKHFKPAPPSPGRPLMEHVLYASLLEDTPADLADEGFAKCEQEFFDWNEVRVTTVTELAEVLSSLPNALTSAMRLKKNLQSMFETFYNFDIDYLKKENLGKAVAKFEAMAGMTPFVLSYLVQHGLGGHAIPVDKSSMRIMWLCGIVSDAESESGKVPGLERTVAKNRSIEFSSLLHQAGVAFQANPNDKVVWDVLLSVNKDAKTLHEQPTAAATSKKSSKSSDSSGSATDKAAPGKSTKSSKPAAAEAPMSAEKKAAKASEAAVKSAESRKAKDKALSSPPKPAPLKAPAAKVIAAKAEVKSAAKSVVKAKPAAKTLDEKATEAKSAKPKEANAKGAEVKAPVTKSPTAKAPAAKAPAEKSPVAKPISTKKSETKTAESKGPVATAKAEPAETKKPLSKKTSAKPVANAPAEPEKKPSAKKPAPAKPLSSKTPAEKPISKKSEVKPETKPASKKVSDPTVAASSKEVTPNKKLTKQKPR